LYPTGSAGGTVPGAVAMTVETTPPDPVLAWCHALEERHLRELTFPEVRRGLEALSTVYVERRDRLGRGAALDGAGKRAAFALFYGPLHFLVTREILARLPLSGARLERVVDLGCGTGAVGAAVALAASVRPAMLGVDVNRWAVDEARWTYRQLGLAGEARVGDAGRAIGGSTGTALVAGYTVNELDDARRDEWLARLLTAARAGAHVLVVEPIAIRPLPWWDGWSARFADLGGRADEWEFPLQLPPRQALLSKAAGLRHQRVKARTLYLGAPGA
jgi:hypothetical protein